MPDHVIRRAYTDRENVATSRDFFFYSSLHDEKLAGDALVSLNALDWQGRETPGNMRIIVYNFFVKFSSCRERAARRTGGRARARAIMTYNLARQWIRIAHVERFPGPRCNLRLNALHSPSSCNPRACLPAMMYKERPGITARVTRRGSYIRLINFTNIRPRFASSSLYPAVVFATIRTTLLLLSGSRSRHLHCRNALGIVKRSFENAPKT